MSCSDLVSETSFPPCQPCTSQLKASFAWSTMKGPAKGACQGLLQGKQCSMAAMSGGCQISPLTSNGPITSVGGMGCISETTEHHNGESPNNHSWSHLNVPEHVLAEATLALHHPTLARATRPHYYNLVLSRDFDILCYGLADSHPRFVYGMPWRYHLSCA